MVADIFREDSYIILRAGEEALNKGTVSVWLLP